MTERKAESRLYLLKRDGETVAVGTELDCVGFLHRTHSFSVDHALKYEGYSIERIKTTEDKEN